MKTAIINGKIVLPDSVLEGKALVFEGGKITDITDTVPTGAKVVDAAGNWIAPGFIDVHIHGSMGADTMDENPESVRIIAEGIAKYGVTSFLPTTMTMSMPDIHRSLGHVRHWMKQDIKGAKVLGAHMEGPFINVKYKGAQNPEYILAPNFEDVMKYEDVIRLITYAPEMDQGLAFTKQIKNETDITLSMGHTDATFDQAMEAIYCGCSHVTHLFNAQTPLHHRDPGVVGAALMSDVFTEVIADNIHINPHNFQFVLDNKGPKRVVLITDSMRAGCMKDGNYDLGGQAVIVKDGAARLESGTLAGSVLTLNIAVKNFYEATKATISEAIHSASLNPATSIGMDKYKGSLEIGKDADVIILSPEFECLKGFSEGREIV
ncbi:MAG: N-acetylglucosamine-6-phosphate deacetylase [Turicibacter sp.]|nr:N-acetylglucosamine-6-phosphate deacetylase [Turicibacter sp.]